MPRLPWLAPVGHNQPPATQASQEALDGIAFFEGFFSRPYLCPAGHWTYGFGSIYDVNGRRVSKSTPSITREKAMELLERDVKIAEDAVLRLLPPLTQPRFDACVSFTYNLGSGALQRSTLRRKIRNGEHEDAEREFGRWIYAGGKPLKGLMRRREWEASLYARG